MFAKEEVLPAAGEQFGRGGDAALRSRVTSPILCDEDRGHGRADPIDLLDRPIAAIVTQPVVDDPFEHTPE